MKVKIKFAFLRFAAVKLVCLILCSNFSILNGDFVAKRSVTTQPSSQIRAFGNGFWNVRVPFKMVGVDIGTHMSIIQLRNGRFLIIDTVAINDELREKLNELTADGTKIEAVVAVHPFHTLAYSAFHKLYPNATYYGTPRHLRKLPEIEWAGQLDLDENRNLLSKWAPEVELRIPDGAEYYSPLPESLNHFVSVFVYHRESRTLHVDDTLIYIEAPTWPISLLLQPGTLIFHPSLIIGLNPNPDAPLQFYSWMKQILKDWDIENLCTAHIGAKIGGAHSAIKQLVINSETMFEGLSELHGRSLLFSVLLSFSQPLGQVVEYLSTIIS